jgi:ubiquitin carboxyl-terminal hydrolase 34
LITPSVFDCGGPSLTGRASDDQVARAFVEWIDKYLGYVKAASPRAVDESYVMYQDMWQPVPQLVLHMVNRK